MLGAHDFVLPFFSEGIAGKRRGSLLNRSPATAPSQPRQPSQLSQPILLCQPSRPSRLLRQHNRCVLLRQPWQGSARQANRAAVSTDQGSARQQLLSEQTVDLFSAQTAALLSELATELLSEQTADLLSSVVRAYNGTIV